ncbi:nucleoporin Nup188 [Euwallacea fornicatus]|uniref:nucleoporin Nup188 n=1 Tax=Euwallacea fornicatus TaxID=995702 RepID=UPI00338E28B2
MEDSDTLPVWQKLYQIVSGSIQNVIPEVLEEVLGIIEEKMVSILLGFKVYTRPSFDEWRKRSRTMLVAQDDEMSCFVHRMSRELDLDVNIAWSVICNFLIFGYYGKVSELKSIICYEANSKSIIEHLWIFYASDRMFLLKTIRFILEKLSEKTYIYHKQFYAIFEEVDLKDLWQNTIKSFENLLMEIDVEKSNRVCEEDLKKWIQRNNREQIEVLLLMIQLASLTELRLSGNELADVIKLFLRHGFGRHPLFIGAGSLSRPKDIVDIKNAEVGVVLTLVHRFWLKPAIFKMLPREIEVDLEQYQVQGDNGVILFIWAIFKSTQTTAHLEYGRSAIEALLHQKVFRSLAKCITSNIFQNCQPGKIVMEATCRLFVEFGELVNDHRFIYEQEGVLDIICELYKNPKLHALEKLGVYVQIGLDMFPYKLDNFLRIIESVVSSEDHLDKVMKLLRNCPTYCTDLEWLYSSDAVRSTQPTSLFLGSSQFIIPADTLTEKCSCFGVDLMKFHYKFDFFEIIGQFIKSLTMWAVNNGDINKSVSNSLLRATKFLNFLIKHYKGNFNDDRVIKPLLQRLDCVPTYFIKSGFKSFDFFYVYFEAKCALIRYQNIDFQEAFPLLIQKLLFPSFSDYRTAAAELKLLKSGHECILFRFLKEEESRPRHKLLLEYIHLIIKVLQDNLHNEFLYSGIWYLLYVAFPSHKQWCFKEGDFEQMKVLNGCLSVFINVLQQNSKNSLSNVGQKQIYHLVQNAFINDPFIIDNLYDVFVKDKFFLPTLMHQESNWIVGKTLVVQETVKQELLMLLLIFKCRAQIPDTKCEIDRRTHVFAKSASVYFITPYNSTLAVLASKFLDMLGRDESIPLMSCLGVDYDQTQTLFLERLRDPMEDEDVKVNILNLISTCVLHQTGMTAAFFNVQSSKKWYNPDVKKIAGDTVGDFMLDYLKNIKRSVTYLKSPLQIGVLKVMANLWQCQKQHLIKDIMESKDFWSLVSDPLLKPFELNPLVYTYLIQILAIQFAIALREPERKKNDFFLAVEKFMDNEVQLTMFQDYLYKIFSNEHLQLELLQEREVLLQAWTELLVTSQKQNEIKSFPTSDSKYIYVELAFECLRKEIVHRNILSTWLDFIVVVLNMFGLKFDDKLDKIAENANEYAKIVQLYYERMCLKDKRSALTGILLIVRELKAYYEKNPASLLALLEEIATIVDIEYKVLSSQVFSRFRDNDLSAREYLGPWTLILCTGNCVLSIKSCGHFSVWFSNRRYLEKLLACTSELLSYKKGRSTGELALYGMTLYVQSPLAKDFLKLNMIQFFDRVEPLVSALISGHVSKVNVLDLQEAWLISNLLVKFNQAFLKTFKKNAVGTCYAFLSLNQNIIKHVTNLPENTVDFKALDLLTQTLILYYEILKNWKIHWCKKSNKTFNLMTEGIRKAINACIYLCLRPKHIGFYCLDNYYRLVPVDQFITPINDLMIAVIDRLIGILGLAFSCLYELNASLLELFEYYESEESDIVLIKNDFSVPRFELPIPYDLTYGKLLCLAHFLCKTMNQLHQKKDSKEKQQTTIHEHSSYYIGLVEHQDPSDYMPDQKLSSFLRYLYEYSGLIDPWINNLNYENTHRTADVLMMFIAQQAFLTIKLLEPAQVPYYKRNLYSELQFFHEYIKKRTSELTNLISTSPGCSSELDHMKRYLQFHWKEEGGKTKVAKVADENFLLIISFWFSNVCQIQ